MVAPGVYDSFLFCLYIAAFVVAVVSCIQFLFAIITGQDEPKLRRMGLGISEYIKQGLMFLTYNTEEKPFPFADWPEVPEPLNDSASSDSVAETSAEPELEDTQEVSAEAVAEAAPEQAPAEPEDKPEEEPVAESSQTETSEKDEEVEPKAESEEPEPEKEKTP